MTSRLCLSSSGLSILILPMNTLVDILTTAAKKNATTSYLLLHFAHPNADISYMFPQGHKVTKRHHRSLVTAELCYERLQLDASKGNHPAGALSFELRLRPRCCSSTSSAQRENPRFFAIAIADSPALLQSTSTPCSSSTFATGRTRSSHALLVRQNFLVLADATR